MSYSDLANEIILHIISYVSLSNIESFALLDKRTFELSLPKLERRRAINYNASIMTARFGGAHKPIDWRWVLERSPKLAEKYAVPPAEHRLDELEYLQLNGDLHWLQTMDADSMRESAEWPQGEGESEEKLAKLVEDGRRVGIKFPPGFLKLMASTELMQCFFLGGSYFALGPSLIKCNAEDDNGGGGYVIRFHCDQQSCAFWALYLDPQGHHCVLYIPCSQDVHCWKCDYNDSSPTAFEDHPKYEVYKGIPIACEKLKLEQAHPNFEEWLVRLYFQGWCCTTVRDRELSVPQMEYLRHLLIERS